MAGQFLGRHGDHDQEGTNGVLDVEMTTQRGKGVLDEGPLVGGYGVEDPTQEPITGLPRHAAGLMPKAPRHGVLDGFLGRILGQLDKVPPVGHLAKQGG